MGSSKTFQCSPCRDTTESVLSMMSCPKCKHAAVLFTHVFNFIEIGEKIRAHGHDFEDVISAYLNWKTPMEDVTDLIGQLEALKVVKYSPRWYNIVERNRGHIGQKRNHWKNREGLNIRATTF